jgi:hypothetical protein
MVIVFEDSFYQQDQIGPDGPFWRPPYVPVGTREFKRATIMPYSRSLSRTVFTSETRFCMYADCSLESIRTISMSRPDRRAVDLVKRKPEDAGDVSIIHTVSTFVGG